LSFPTRLPLKSTIEDIDTTVTSIQADVTDIDTTVTSIQADVTDIDTKVTAIENYIDRVPDMRMEVAQAEPAENAAVEVNTTDLTSLGAKDITISLPTGATIEKVIALARVAIMNNAASAQKIDLQLAVEGVTLFSQLDVVGFPAAEGASSIFPIAEDASDEVTAVGQVVTLEAKAQLSAAAAVRFQVEYFLFITYRTG